jgi:hypothetical protein
LSSCTTSKWPFIRQHCIPFASVAKKETFDEFVRQFKEMPLDPWTIAALTETDIRLNLQDSEHSVPKYVVFIDSCLHFSLHVFNWLVPDQYKIIQAVDE